jgi:mono/diheme cytochrome c family protein
MLGEMPWRAVMKQRFIGAVILGTTLVVVPMSGYTQTADIGKREYLNSCAVCHGDSGRGDGPIVAYLKTPPTDLTKIQKNNMGVFPYGRVYAVIDGREMIAGHGPGDMPVWGDRFKKYNAELAELALRFGTRIDSEAFARDRILALIRYIFSLQEK